MAFGIICLIYVIGLAIIAAELFVPGTFLGFVGSGLIITSIVLAFYHHPPLYGISLVFITSIVVPAMMIWWLGKVSLTSSQSVEDGYISTDESLEELLGKEGITLTLLRPTGIAKIGNRRVDVTSEHIAVPKDVTVKVVKVEGNRVIVKPLESDIKS